MALYTIKYRCGHAAERQIYGTDVGGERQRKADWLAGQNCADCAAAARHVERDAVNVLTAELAAAEALPPLAGSEKQVVWATTIRAEALDKLTERGSRQAKLAATPEQHAELDDVMARCRTALVAQTEARWWINRRGDLNTMIHDAGVTR